MASQKFQEKRQGCEFRLSTNDSIVMYVLQTPQQNLRTESIVVKTMSG